MCKRGQRVFCACTEAFKTCLREHASSCAFSWQRGLLADDVCAAKEVNVIARGPKVLVSFLVFEVAL